jgi:hypothetical protein
MAKVGVLGALPLSYTGNIGAHVFRRVSYDELLL